MTDHGTGLLYHLFAHGTQPVRKLKGVGGPSGTKRGAPTDGEGDDSNKALKESDAIIIPSMIYNMPMYATI